MTYQPSQENKVKDKLRDALDLHPDRVDHFPVTNNGRGVGGVPDRCGTVKLDALLSNGLEAARDAETAYGEMMRQDDLPLSAKIENVVESETLAVELGVAFRIECKGYDTGKKADPTALQLRSLEGNAALGGFSAVCRPSIQTVYFSDGTGVDMVMSPAELVEYMLSGEWVR